MLLKRQRSIFYLGEEGGTQHVKSVDDSEGSRDQEGRQRTERDDDVVGLRILVAHQRRQHSSLASSRSHIVLKQMVVAQPHRSCCFLRACARCRRELCPDKDVYMYRGDQGFCSEECRRRQILTDEAREREAMVKKHRRGLSIQHHHGPRSAATTAVRGAPRRLLAVA